MDRSDLELVVKLSGRQLSNELANPAREKALFVLLRIAMLTDGGTNTILASSLSIAARLVLLLEQILDSLIQSRLMQCDEPCNQTYVVRKERDNIATAGRTTYCTNISVAESALVLTSMLLRVAHTENLIPKHLGLTRYSFIGDSAWSRSRTEEIHIFRLCSSSTVFF